jgi:hypothetical protein
MFLHVGTLFFYPLINIFRYILFGSFFPLPPTPCPLPHPPHFQAEPVLPLSLILLKRRHSDHKEDKAFLLVEIRIAIRRDS